MFFLFALLVGTWFACTAHDIEGWYRFSIIVNVYLLHSWFNGWKVTKALFKVHKTAQTALAHIPDKRVRERVRTSEFHDGKVLGVRL